MYIEIETWDLYSLKKSVNELREKMIEKEVHDDLFGYVTELDVKIANMLSNAKEVEK